MTMAVHGGMSERERGAILARGLLPLDLSANLNPYGPPPAVLAAAAHADAGRYPEPNAGRLCRAIARFVGCTPAMVMAGNGSSELIFLAARAFGTPGRPGLVATPTFAEYGRALRAAGVHALELRCFGPDGAGLEPAIDAARSAEPGVIFVCSPNNPTGDLLPDDRLEELRRAARTVGAVLVIDEAYRELGGVPDSRWFEREGVVVLRSLTKLYAIPGLRVGYALGSPDLIGAMREQQPPWSVSAPAIAAALRALRERAFVRRSVARIIEARARLTDGLRRAGFAVLGSDANFVLVEVGDAGSARKRLLERGIAVRDCSSFGLPSHVRIAVPRLEDVDRVISAMEELRCRRAGC
jgi:L-threonine-O-3-phosphate decarboxylase